MWIISLAFANSVESHMWQRCVDEGLLTEADHERAHKAIFGHAPGSPVLGAELGALIERNPDCPALWMARAGVHHAEGRKTDAMADLRHAATRGADWPEVQRALAVAMHNDGGAGELLDTAIALNPGDPLLKLYRAAERPLSERPALMREAVKAHPEDVDVALAAIDTLEQAGRPLEAIALAHERQAHLRDDTLASRLGQLEAPYSFDEEERARRPTEFRTLDDGTEEVVVYSPKRAREALTQRLADIGYREAKAIDGGMRYRTDKPVMPWVEIYDDGRIEVQKSGLVSTGPNPDGSTPIPVVSKRKLAKRRTKVMESIWYEVTAWRQARIRVSFQEQLGQFLPDQLIGVWEQGQPMYGEGSLDDPAARRGELLDYWATRACNPDGDAAREVVETFLRREVQESDTPATPAEIAAAQSKCTCEGRVLDLGESL